MSRHVVHWDDPPQRRRVNGDISATWTDLGTATGSVDIGLTRLQVDPGRRSTPPHVHGAEEEIFFVLGGSGLLWQDGDACRVDPGDCIVHLPLSVTHTLRAGADGLDVLAFGTRVLIELCYLPRAGHAWAGPTVVAAPGMRNLFRLDDEAGMLEFPAPGPRPANVVALADVPGEQREGRVRTDLGTAAGSARTGLKHVLLEPGVLSAPPHFHSADQELLVVLQGEGVLQLGDEEHQVRPGHVVARPAGTRVAHAFRAGASGMALLAYGTRDPNDACFFPRSNKIVWRGLGVVGRIEQLDFWDGEPLA
ncbi:MAG: cupin domain-containing protein [Gaiellales bacterium]